MTEGQGDQKRWQRWNRFWLWVGSVAKTGFQNLAGVRGLTGILAVVWFLATAVASWWYTDSSFGNFSQKLGFPIATAFLGVWIADYYYRKDAYAKRFRDVRVSVYTIQLLMAGVQAMKLHISTAKEGVVAFKASNDDQHSHKLKAHSQIEASYTAADLTIRMAFMALANLELFSLEAVNSGKEKFAKDEKDAKVLQRMVPGSGSSDENTNGGVNQ